MWTALVIALIGATLANCDTAHVKAGVHQPQQQQTTEFNYQNYPYYQQYYPSYSNGQVGQVGHAYNYLGSVQKQDAGGDLLGNLFGGDGGGDGGGDIAGIAGTAVSALTAIVAALGIKGLAKIVFGGFGLLFLLWLVPLGLSIAALAVALAGDGGQGAGMVDKMMDFAGLNKGNRNAGRAIDALNMVFSSEQCVERISCSISRRAFGQRKLRGHKKNGKESAENEARNKGEDVKSETPLRRESILSRISRGIKSDDCEAYKCRLASYFS